MLRRGNKAVGTLSVDHCRWIIMTIASYTIHKCRGTDGFVRPDRIVAVIKEIGANLATLQEVDLDPVDGNFLSTMS